MMKLKIKAINTLALIIGIAAILSPFGVMAQDYAVKAYSDVGLVEGKSMTMALPQMTSKMSSNAFGVDFGWKFWNKNAHSLEANLGLGYRIASATFDVTSMSYNYAAPAEADEDGNSYQRYTTLSDLKQKINLGYLNIPVYLQYQYRATKWLGIHADFGFHLGFKCSGSIGSTSGIADSYGVYSQYEDLVIKADYLNDFGERSLKEAYNDEPKVNGFSASIIAGAGLEFYVGSRVSIDLGVRYNTGLTSVFKNMYDLNSTTSLTSENAPVTYTVTQGQRVNAMSDYVTKSPLNSLSLHIGVNLRF